MHLHAESKVPAFFFYLFGNLAKVADVSQDCTLDDGVLSIPPASLSIEVRVECVHTFYSSRTLLPVPKNQIYPQVEVGTHVVTFQGLRETEKKTVEQTEIN